MAVGDVIIPTPANRHQTAMLNRLGPRKAMGLALEAFLRKLTFRVDGGDDRDREFRLEQVLDEWPDPSRRLEYPSASYLDVPGTEILAHNLTPTALEETWGQFDVLAGFCDEREPGRTVLWKEGGASTTFQVDFWCDGHAQRQAVEASLSTHFNPEDGRAGVLVEGPLLYYSRPMRFTVSAPRYDDTATTAYANERRLRCVVTGECDIVSLRMATAMEKPRVCLDVIDPNDPKEESA